ncbi:MAG: carbohydrate ABC transporter permease [Clostridia bacterium]|nr:carbohydrate ABC transporter permease [Clostridia bacterium]
MKRKNRKITFLRVLRMAYLFINIAAMLVPLIFMFLNAFRTDSEITLRPFGFPSGGGAVVQNIRDVINGTITIRGKVRLTLTPYFTMLKNTVVLTVFPMILMLVCSTLCAYALGRMKLKFKWFVASIIFICQTVPYFGYMYPMFFELNFLGLLNSLTGVIPVYVAVSMPSSIILMIGFFNVFPAAVEEAAMIDGCNEFQKFTRIVVPMSRGIIGSMAVINFMGYWNEFAIVSLMLTSPETRTLNMGVFLTQNDMKGINAKNYVFALLALSAIPNLLFFTLFQKNIINGISLGSVKG